MRKSMASGVGAIVVLLCSAASAHGQFVTERYIPIGRSPGISGQYSYIGQIQAVDRENRTITVEGPAGARTIEVTEETWIWLDRSEQRLTNLVGGMEDLQPGRRVEIKYADPETRETAEWIKVAVPGGG